MDFINVAIKIKKGDICFTFIYFIEIHLSYCANKENTSRSILDSSD